MGFRILIVEDETAVRKMLTVAFTKAGYEVLGAAHAPDAMNMLAIEKVDAVLSDVLLNSLSGHDLARWVAEHHPSVPCVLMTGFDDTDCDNCPFASGCIQIRKPFNPKDAVVSWFEPLELPVSMGKLFRSLRHLTNLLIRAITPNLASGHTFPASVAPRYPIWPTSLNNN